MPGCDLIYSICQMSQDRFILTIGAEVGGCLVDGLGDGVIVEAPGLETEMLRSTCFGLLQVQYIVIIRSNLTP